MTEQTRERFRNDEKKRIVRERGYVNLELNFEEVAGMSYSPARSRKPYRLVIVRKNISKMKGEQTFGLV